MPNKLSISASLLEIKTIYEAAIKRDGVKGKTSIIRSKELIGNINEFIKQELVKNGVNKNKIYPPLGKTSPELKMNGQMKGKSQDILILPEEPKPPEKAEINILGQKSRINNKLMNKSISINIRSQLSSIGANFDTIYERTIFESLNLHLKAPKLIMGDVFMVPLVAYYPEPMKKKKVRWKEKLPRLYLKAFEEINGRKSTRDKHYKYERVCLLIADFRKAKPTVIKSLNPLVKEGIFDKGTPGNPLTNLSINNFVPDLLDIYETRHGSLGALK